MALYKLDRMGLVAAGASTVLFSKSPMLRVNVPSISPAAPLSAPVNTPGPVDSAAVTASGAASGDPGAMSDGPPWGLIVGLGLAGVAAIGGVVYWRRRKKSSTAGYRRRARR
jgi:LPXTG-motif cell wall-anchored protein